MDKETFFIKRTNEDSNLITFKNNDSHSIINKTEFLSSCDFVQNDRLITLGKNNSNDDENESKKYDLLETIDSNDSKLNNDAKVMLFKKLEFKQNFIRKNEMKKPNKSEIPMSILSNQKLPRLPKNAKQNLKKEDNLTHFNKTLVKKRLIDVYYEDKSKLIKQKKFLESHIINKVSKLHN